MSGSQQKYGTSQDSSSSNTVIRVQPLQANELVPASNKLPMPSLGLSTTNTQVLMDAWTLGDRLVTPVSSIQKSPQNINKPVSKQKGCCSRLFG